MTDEYDWTRDHDWIGDEDPEVVADARPRAATERQRGRRPADLAWQMPVYVAWWRCRVPRCTELMPVTQEAVTAREVWCHILARRGQAEIDTDSILLCRTHQLAQDEARREAQESRRGRINAVLRELVASGEASEASISKLRSDHHPDVDGLLHHLRRRARL